jgi:hypothetical protein
VSRASCAYPLPEPLSVGTFYPEGFPKTIHAYTDSVPAGDAAMTPHTRMKPRNSLAVRLIRRALECSGTAYVGDGSFAGYEARLGFILCLTFPETKL